MQRLTPAVLAVAVFLSVNLTARTAEYEFVRITDSDALNYDVLSTPFINSLGEMAFSARDNDGREAIVRATESSVTVVVDNSGEFSRFSEGTPITDDGDIVFMAVLDEGGGGIFVTDGVTTTPLWTSPDTPFFNNMPITAFSQWPAVNPQGDIAYVVPDCPGDGCRPDILYRLDGDGLVEIANRSDPNISTIGTPSINASGQVAVLLNFDRVRPLRLVVSDGNQLTTLQTGDVLFDRFGFAEINDGGTVLFPASEVNAIAGTEAGYYLIEDDGTMLRDYVDNTGPFNMEFNIGRPAMNNAGTIVFQSPLDGMVQIPSLYIGVDPVKDRLLGRDDIAPDFPVVAASNGDPYLSTIMSLSSFTQSLNDAGQIAFSAGVCIPSQFARCTFDEFGVRIINAIYLANPLADGETGDATVLAETTWVSGNGHRYAIVEHPARSWDQANANIGDVLPGYHLATITSQEEQEFLEGFVASSQGILWDWWLGGSQAPGEEVDPAEGWSWVTGESWIYENWIPSQPDDSLGIEDYLALKPSANGWNDEIVGTENSFSRPGGTLRGKLRGYLAELGRFDDVAADYWAFSFIESLAAARISVGCGTGNFCPNDTVTRAQMAVFLERAIRGSDFVPPPATGTVFVDVGANDFAAAFIEQLEADRITRGCGTGNYCPNSAITRAQMAVFLLRALRGADYIPPAAVGIFNDVGPGSFAAGWIEQLAADGITNGCGGGNFCPGSPVTRAQMAVFLVRAFDL